MDRVAIVHLIHILICKAERKRFDMEHYLEGHTGAYTRACPVGLASLDPWFQERGLRPRIVDDRYEGVDHMRPHEIFGLDIHTYQAICTPIGYLRSPQPIHVACRLMALVCPRHYWMRRALIGLIAAALRVRSRLALLHLQWQFR